MIVYSKEQELEFQHTLFERFKFTRSIVAHLIKSTWTNRWRIWTALFRTWSPLSIKIFLYIYSHHLPITSPAS